MVNLLRTIFKTASKELNGGYHQTKRLVNELNYQDMLYSSDYLMKLIMRAKELKDKDSLFTIFKYLKKHEEVIKDVGSYRKLFSILRDLM